MISQRMQKGNTTPTEKKPTEKKNRNVQTKICTRKLTSTK